jgi:hypothetical protein
VKENLLRARARIMPTVNYKRQRLSGIDCTTGEPVPQSKGGCKRGRCGEMRFEVSSGVTRGHQARYAAGRDRHGRAIGLLGRAWSDALLGFVGAVRQSIPLIGLAIGLNGEGSQAQ